MTPEEVGTLDTLIKSLGLDPVKIGSWATFLMTLRVVLKLVSGKVQKGLETAIEKARASGDKAIVEWLARVINSRPYKVTAWLVDTVFSVKLPLKVKGKEMPGS